jgi:hypothetical protein
LGLASLAIFSRIACVMILDTGKLPSSRERAFAHSSISKGIEMLVFTNAVCTEQLLLPSSKKSQ